MCRFQHTDAHLKITETNVCISKFYDNGIPQKLILYKKIPKIPKNSKQYQQYILRLRRTLSLFFFYLSFYKQNDIPMLLMHLCAQKAKS